jgi:hypothetical protein
LSATSITAQTGTTAIPIQGLGKAGAGEGISALVAATAGLSQQGSGTVPQALADLQQAQYQCTNLSGLAATLLSSSLASRVLTSGVYYE